MPEPKAYGSIVEVKIEAEPDGAHVIKVCDFAGDPFEVLVTPDEAPLLVRALLDAAIRLANEGGRSPQLPEAHIRRVDLAHQGTGTALMVSTFEIGTWVLHMTPEVLKHLRSEIDRALVYLSGPSAAN